MTEDPSGPDDLVTLGGAGLEGDFRTDLYVGPLADPDRYELLGTPLQGGEGTTWRARYRGDLDQPVQSAIKVLGRPHGAGDAWPTPALMRAWRDRVELLHSADLPHVVRLHDVEIGCEPHRLGVADTPRTVLVRMEWVPGPTLATAVGGTPATEESLPRRLGWLDDLCVALGGLHALGNTAVHRDVTPANCIVTAERGLVLIDLSTMQLPHDGADLQGRYTPLYSAPEVVAAPHSPRSAAADRWSVGAIAFFLLTGAHPPRDLGELAERLRDVAGRLRAPQAESIVLELLDEDPDARPADLLDWAARLRATLQRPVHRRRRVVVPIAVAAGLIVVAAAVVPFAMRALPFDDVVEAAPRSASVAPSPTLSIRQTAANGASARITAPADGEDIGSCVVLRGSASLPADTLLVLVQRFDEGATSNEPYVEWPLNWNTLTGDTTFAGVQYFNEATRGQHLLLQVVAVDRAAAEAQYAKDEPETDYEGDFALVAGGTILDSVRVLHSLPGTDTSCSVE